MESLRKSGLQVFSTCPQSKGANQSEYLRQVVKVAQWSEEAGCEGILVYTDNGLVDPWLVSQIIVQNTRRLSPLVAVQPIYLHPYSVAKMVSTIGYLYGRRMFLNMVAGGFKNDLAALADNTEHDRRYDRLVEYTRIITGLLEGGAPVTLEGEFYQVRNLTLTPPLPAELRPGITLSGSSDAGLAAARAVGAIAVEYPKPVAEYDGTRAASGPVGIRIGVIARADADDAWVAANQRFPEDRRGQIEHQLAMKVSDSSWHRQLSALGEKPAGPANPYWLRPFENYKTFCPYLVGSYEQVADEISRYLEVGYETFILDIPASAEELEHIGKTFALAKARATP